MSFFDLLILKIIDDYCHQYFCA